MKIGKVIGTVVSTRKLEAFRGVKFLILQPLDENLEPLPVPVRVGLAVDIAGQAGKPKTITGFQTHTSPVLMAYGERAELGAEEYLTQTTILEDIVLLKANPDYIPKK